MPAANKKVGVRAIAQYLGRSEGSVMNYWRDQNLPIYKVGGIWEATEKDLDDWKNHQKAGEWYERKEKKSKKA
jgi:hypothetical protein